MSGSLGPLPPAPRPTRHCRTDRCFLRRLTGNQAPRILGIGSFGAAWLVAPGRVVKITASPAEAWCVAHVLTIPNPPPALPLIYRAGTLPRSVRNFEYGDEVLLLADDIWWYEREELASLPPHAASRAADILNDLPTTPDESAQLLAAAIARTARALHTVGFHPIDATPDNWGLRANGDLVLRDLACNTATHAFKGDHQHIARKPVWPPPDPFPDYNP